MKKKQRRALQWAVAHSGLNGVHRSALLELLSACASDVRIAALEEAYQAALSCDGALNNAGAVAMKIRALIKRDDTTAASKDAIEAKRYRFLRENMRFSSPRGEMTTMTMRAPIPAPTHDIHNDWMGERFDASVDRAIDAALAKESEND